MTGGGVGGPRNDMDLGMHDSVERPAPVTVWELDVTHIPSLCVLRALRGSNPSSTASFANTETAKDCIE